MKKALRKRLRHPFPHSSATAPSSQARGVHCNIPRRMADSTPSTRVMYASARRRKTPRPQGQAHGSSSQEKSEQARKRRKKGAGRGGGVGGKDGKPDARVDGKKAWETHPRPGRPVPWHPQHPHALPAPAPSALFLCSLSSRVR